MSDRWAALINLAQDKQERLVAMVTAMGIRAVPMGWDQLTDPAPSDPQPSTLPALLIAHGEEFSRENVRREWHRPEEVQRTIVLLAPAALTAETLRIQIHYDVFNVIPDALWNDPLCFERTMRGLLFPEEMFDVSRFVSNATTFKRFLITNLDEKHQVADEVAELARPFAEASQRIRDIRLIITELTNNAFFHSFLGDEGEEKYSPRRFLQLEQKDRVLLETAISEEAICMAVEDNRGTLKPQQALKYLLRQTSGEGVYDSHGRGFYLISNLVNHLDICLVPGVRMRVVALIHIKPASPVRTLNFFVCR